MRILILTGFLSVLLFAARPSRAQTAITYDATYLENAGFPGGIRPGTITGASSANGWQQLISSAINTNRWSTGQAVPFAFSFFGQPVTQFKVSANGLLTFDVASTRLPSANEQLPSARLPDQTVAVFWDNFTGGAPTGSNDIVWSRVFGTAPARQLWVVWDSFEQGDPEVEFSYHACVLEETSNNVYVVDQYSSVNGLSATVGIQRDATYAVQYGTAETQLAGNSNALVSEVDYFQFTPRPVVPGADVALNGLAAPLPRQSCYDVNAAVSVVLHNAGTTPLTNVAVSAQVHQGTTTQTMQGMYAGAPIAPGQVALLTLAGNSLNLQSGGTFSVTSTATLPGGDVYQANNTAAPRTLTFPARPTFAPPGLLTFTNYNGSNLAIIAPGWRETDGTRQPGNGEMSTAWTSALASQQAGLGSETGSYVFGAGTSKIRSWLVSPEFNLPAGQHLFFRAAITDFSSAGPSHLGSSDSVKFWLTTNCGQTWQLLRLFTAADSLPNVLQPFAVDLSAYAGQIIRIGVQAARPATGLAPTAAFHLDDLEVRAPASTDVAPVALVSPLTPACYGAAESVRVRVHNFGTAAASNIPVQVTVTGPFATVLFGTLPGPLYPGNDAELTVGTANLSLPGTYTFEARTQLPADGQPTNDYLGPVSRVVPTTVVPSAVPPVTFTGFGGSNLATISPGWREAKGLVLPNTGGSALWTPPSAAHIAALGSETASLGLFGTTSAEWIISPSFVLGTGPSFLNFRLALTDLTPQAAATTMGSDDSLRVLISTDCGRSFQRLRVFSHATPLANRLQPVSINLAAFASQSVIVAFQATNGPIDDFLVNAQLHLDDIGIQTVPLAAIPQSTAALPIELYPNPATCFANLAVPAAPQAFFQVLDIAGRRVHRGQLQQGRATIPVTILTPGLYQVVVYTSAGQLVRKLVVP